MEITTKQHSKESAFKRKAIRDIMNNASATSNCFATNGSQKDQKKSR